MLLDTDPMFELTAGLMRMHAASQLYRSVVYCVQLGMVTQKSTAGSSLPTLAIGRRST